MTKEIPFYTKLAHITICILGIGYLVIIGKTVLAPLILALLFAMLLIPFANLLERKFRFSRGLACFIVLLVLVVAISGIMVLLGSQLTAFAQDIPAFENQVMEALESLQSWIAESFNIDNRKQAEYINNTTADALGTGTAIIGVTIMSLSSSLLFTVFIFLYTFFLLMHRSLLLRFVLSLFKENHSTAVLETVAHIQYIIRKYILGLLLQMGIVAALSCIVFTVLGIKYAFLLGMLTGILNVIPYVGIFISMLLSVLVTFATATPNDILFVAIALSCIHLIDSNYIMPKIVGSKVKLNTLVAVIGLVVGELVWGITGMFLSIPIIAIAKVIFDRVDGLKPWGMVLGEDTVAQTQKNIPAEEELPPLE